MNDDYNDDNEKRMITTLYLSRQFQEGFSKGRVACTRPMRLHTLLHIVRRL